MKVTPQQILDELEIAPGDTLFIKASMRYLGYGPSETSSLLEAILKRIGPEGTVLMPSFPYSNHVGRAPAGFIFDVLNSPSWMGQLSEKFRRMEDTLRSEQYWVPVCARGKYAAKLIAGQRLIMNPYGEGSSYRRMLDYEVKMVGLGVTTNYNALAHVADAVLASKYSFNMYETEPMQGIVIDVAGNRWETSTIIFTQERRKSMKPSLMIEASPALQRELRYFVHDGAIIFSLPGPLYFEESIRVGTEELAHGRLPPWLGSMIRQTS